jgi:hypothetical protein
MRALRWTISACVALAVALPAPAGAVTFGANLDARTPTSDTSCGYPPYYPGVWPLASSCTFFSTATPTGDAAETQVVPLPDPASHGDQHGTITQVRIKTGAGAPGPAKLTVLRAHRAINGGEAACCVGQAESAQFTLNPNTIVNVNTDLPVASLYDGGSQIYSYDILALTVLDESTPIPAEFSGDFNGYCSTGYFPFVQTGQERFSGEYGVCGYLVLMQAEMTVAAKADDNGGEGGGGGDTPPKFRLLGKPKTLGNGRVAMNLELPGAGKLVGNATAKVPAGLLARPSRLAKLVVARRKLNVARAGKVRLLLKPRPAAKKVIDRRGKLKSKARVTYTPAAGATHSFSRSVFFK